MEQLTRAWVRIPSGLGSGLELYVLPPSEPGYVSGCAEPGVHEILSEHIHRGGCFYDVGAHIGYYSLIAARLVGETGQVVAFEPDPDNLELLRTNCERNDLHGVAICTNAAWSHGGKVEFQRGSDNSRMTGRVVDQSSQQAASRSHSLFCNAVTLDLFAMQNRPPSFVKIDVEGGEVEVLKGARTLLAEVGPTLLIEVHDEVSVDAILEILFPLAYVLQPRTSGLAANLNCFVQHRT